MFASRKTVTVCLIVFCIHSLLAQQLRFRHITSEDGLSTNFVKSVFRDAKGFMWFGTQDGLNRYDGYGMKIFRSDPSDETSLCNSEISSLVQPRPDLFLVGTRDGVCLMNPLTEKFSRLAGDGAAMITGRVNAMLVRDTQHVLIGTASGLFQLNHRTQKVEAIDFGDPASPEIKALAEVNGLIYIGTSGKGLWKMTASLKAGKAALLIPGHVNVKQEDLETITDIEEYGGHLYLGTFGSGIMKIGASREIESHISFRAQNENADVVRDLVIRNNRIYAATAYGVVVYNLLSGHVSHYTRQEAQLSLNSNPCNCIYSDPQGNLWVGTDLGGVNVAFFRSLKFPVSIYGYETSFDNIYAFYEVKPGAVMLGGVKTLHELDLGTGEATDHSALLGTGTALCILKETEDIYWIGTWGNGIYRYDKKTRKSRNVLSNKLGGTIVSLYIHGSDLFAGSVGDGLFRINMRSLAVTRYAEAEGLPSLSVNSIFRDSKGRVWLGTYDGGLVQMNGFGKDGRLPIAKIYSNSGQKGQIASNVVFSVNEDTLGRIWATTSLGVSKLLGDGSFRNFYEKDGLANSYLYSLLRDSSGHFWMSSNGGVIRFNPLLPEREIVFKNYGVKDGLMNTEYNMGAAHASSSGMMYFGGPRGFNAFRPSGVKDNLNAPPVYVNGYKRGGKDVETDTLVAYKKHLQLRWKENYFQFEVVALDYTDPPKNKYRYMLEGYDSDWSSPTSVRYISYTELPGGTYTFKVKAANNDGIWNEQPYEITITVVPPFWKTNAFYVMVMLVALTLVYVFIQYRTRAVKRENRLLEAKVAERTRELEARNRDITSSIEYAKRIQEAILPSKDHIFQKLKKVFILYRPKDIVSGDFYWFGERNGIKVFAVVDCTGHGVPGAFMSMIGHNLLHQIVSEKGITDPGEILTQLHRGVQKALRQGQNEIKTNDGMDVSLIAINDASREVRWSGANRPLILIDVEGNFTRYDGNKYPVGGAQADRDRVFTTHIIKPVVATMAYMFSDGYADQFGGDRGKKFMVKRFHSLLSNIHRLEPEAQQEELERQFHAWRQNHEQVDDVLIAGVEI